MSKKALDQLTESMYYVLMALADGPKCGTEIAGYIGEKTRNEVAIGPATLYTVLGKFETEQYIREIAVEGRKRSYSITEAGLAAYQTELRRLWRCVMDAGVKEVSGHEETDTSQTAPVPLPAL